MNQNKKPAASLGVAIEGWYVYGCLRIYGAGEESQEFLRQFDSNRPGLEAMCKWARESAAAAGLPESELIDVCLEEQEPASIGVYSVLEAQPRIRLHLADAGTLKPKSGETDPRSLCRKLAESGAAGQLKTIHVPEKALREVRSLTRHSLDLERQCREAEKTVKQILSEVSGETACFDLRLDDPAVRKQLSQAAAGKKTARREAFAMPMLSKVDAFMLKDSLDWLDQNEKSLQKYQKKMKMLLAPYEKTLDRLESIPDLSRAQAMGLLCEIGTDLHAFADADAFIQWCGFASGQPLPPKNSEAAWRCHYLSRLLETAPGKRRKGRKQAACCAQKLTEIWRVLKENS